MNEAMENAVMRIYDMALSPQDSIMEAFRSGVAYAASPESLRRVTDDVADGLGMPGHDAENGHAMRLRLYHALKGAMADHE